MSVSGEAAGGGQHRGVVLPAREGPGRGQVMLSLTTQSPSLGKTVFRWPERSYSQRSHSLWGPRRIERAVLVCLSIRPSTILPSTHPPVRLSDHHASIRPSGRLAAQTFGVLSTRNPHVPSFSFSRQREGPRSAAALATVMVAVRADEPPQGCVLASWTLEKLQTGKTRLTSLAGSLSDAAARAVHKLSRPGFSLPGPPFL